LSCARGRRPRLLDASERRGDPVATGVAVPAGPAQFVPPCPSPSSLHLAASYRVASPVPRAVKPLRLEPAASLSRGGKLRRARPLSLPSENLATVGTWQVGGMGWGPAGRGCARVGRVRPRGATAATGGAARLAPAISLLSPMDALQSAMSGCQGPVAAMRRTRHQGRSGEYAIGTRRRTPPQSSGARVQLAGCQDARCVRNYWAGRLHPLESEDGAKNRLDKRHQILQSLSLTPIRRGLRFSSSRFRRPVELKLIHTRLASRARHLTRTHTTAKYNMLIVVSVILVLRKNLQLFFWRYAVSFTSIMDPLLYQKKKNGSLA